MGSLAKTTIDVPLPPREASEQLIPLVQEQGFTVASGTLPGTPQFSFSSEIKALRNALKGTVKFAGNGDGTTIEISLDVAPGEHKALLDGRRNRKTLQQLTDEVAIRLR